MVRILLPQLQERFQYPAKVPKNLFVWKNFSFSIFLAAYVGIYHASIFSNLALNRNF